MSYSVILRYTVTDDAYVRLSKPTIEELQSKIPMYHHTIKTHRVTFLDQSGVEISDDEDLCNAFDELGSHNLIINVIYTAKKGSGLGSQPHAQGEYRRVCTNFKNNQQCRFGQKCHFLHQRHPNISVKSSNTFPSHVQNVRICTNFKNNGQCRFAQKCLYSHQISSNITQNKVCLHFQKGYCSFGDKCRFKHIETKQLETKQLETKQLMVLPYRWMRKQSQHELHDAHSVTQVEGFVFDTKQGDDEWIWCSYDQSLQYEEQFKIRTRFRRITTFRGKVLKIQSKTIGFVEPNYPQENASIGIPFYYDSSINVKKGSMIEYTLQLFTKPKTGYRAVDIKIIYTESDESLKSIDVAKGGNNPRRALKPEIVGSSRFSHDAYVPTPTSSHDMNTQRNNIIGPLPDGRGYATVIFRVNNHHIQAQRKLLKTALEFVNNNPLPAPEKIKRTYGSIKTTSQPSCTAHIAYSTRMDYHSIFNDVVKKQSNNPTQIQLLTEKFKAYHVDEVEYYKAVMTNRDQKLETLNKYMDILPQYNDDLKPTHALTEYMKNHHIVFDDELDSIRVDIDKSNHEYFIDIEAVMKAFDTMHGFVEFIQSHYQSNNCDLLSFIAPSNASKTNIKTLLSDIDATKWNGIDDDGYMISYIVSKQCVILYFGAIPFILRLLLTENVNSYSMKRINVEKMEIKRLTQDMEISIGEMRFNHLLSIVNGKALPLESAPVHEPVSVRYIRLHENVIQFIYNDGTFMEYNYSGKDSKDIRFSNIGLADDEYLIGVLISQRHCLFMTNYHVMNGSACFNSKGDLLFSSANLFQVERGQHIVGLQIPGTDDGTLYSAVSNVIQSEYDVVQIKNAMQTDEGKRDDEKEGGMEEFQQIGDDDLVKFPALFKFIKFEHLLMPKDIMDSNGDDNHTIDDNKHTIDGDDTKNDECIDNVTTEGNNPKTIDKINKHRFFLYGRCGRRGAVPEAIVFSLSSTFYRIAKNFNKIESQMDVDIKIICAESDESLKSIPKLDTLIEFNLKECKHIAVAKGDHKAVNVTTQNMNQEKQAVNVTTQNTKHKAQNENKQNMEKWLCPQCTFANIMDVDQCIICTHTRSMWQCPQCTTINSLDTDKQCTMCRYINSDRYWKCDKCTLINDNNNHNCIMCTQRTQHTQNNNNLGVFMPYASIGAEDEHKSDILTVTLNSGNMIQRKHSIANFDPELELYFIQSQLKDFVKPLHDMNIYTIGDFKNMYKGKRGSFERELIPYMEETLNRKLKLGEKRRLRIICYESATEDTYMNQFGEDRNVFHKLSHMEIKQLFYQTVGGSYVIEEIQDVMNNEDSLRYEVNLWKKCDQLSKSRQEVEKYLWHGTSYDVSNIIIQGGVNRGCSTVGPYGRGTYFAVNASYSVGYCNVHSDGYQYMLLCQVIVGDSTTSSGSIYRVPLKPDETEYDTLVDNVNNPSIYVVWRDCRALPVYRVKFMRRTPNKFDQDKKRAKGFTCEAENAKENETSALEQEIIRNEALYNKWINDTTQLEAEIIHNENLWKQYIKSHTRNQDQNRSGKRPRNHDNNNDKNQQNHHENNNNNENNNFNGGSDNNDNNNNNGDKKKDDDDKDDEDTDEKKYNMTNLKSKMEFVKTLDRYKMMKASETYALHDNELMAVVYYCDSNSACTKMKKAHRCIIKDLYWKELYYHCTNAIEKMYRVFHYRNEEFRQRKAKSQYLYHGSTINILSVYDKEQFFFKTLTSFSTQNFIATDFAADQGMIFIIENAFKGLYEGDLRGANVQWISNYKEYEYIILPTTFNRITKVTPSVTDHTIYIKEEQNVYITFHFKTNINPLLPHSDTVPETMAILYDEFIHDKDDEKVNDNINADIKQRLKVKVYYNNRGYKWKHSDQPLFALKEFVTKKFTELGMSQFELEYDDGINARSVIEDDEDLNDAFQTAKEENRNELIIYITNMDNADADAINSPIYGTGNNNNE